MNSSSNSNNIENAVLSILSIRDSALREIGGIISVAFNKIADTASMDLYAVVKDMENNQGLVSSYKKPLGNNQTLVHFAITEKGREQCAYAPADLEALKTIVEKYLSGKKKEKEEKDAEVDARLLYLKNRKVQIGDRIEFGTYPQLSGGKDKTPISWVVINDIDGKVLLFSEKILDYMSFRHESNTDDFEHIWHDNGFDKDSADEKLRDSEELWKKSDIGRWLNGSAWIFENTGCTDCRNDFFYDGVFTEPEKSVIVDKGHGKVFLLSWKESFGAFGVDEDIPEYHPDTEYDDIRHCRWRRVVTEFAAERWSGGKTEKFLAKPPRWWLRTPARDFGKAAVYMPKGSWWSGEVMTEPFIGVRPAIWLNIDDERVDLIKKSQGQRNAVFSISFKEC